MELNLKQFVFEEEVTIRSPGFPKDKLHPDLVINERLQDLMLDFSEQEVFDCLFGFEAFEMLNVHIDNLILTYGHEKVQEIVNMFFEDLTLRGLK